MPLQNQNTYAQTKALILAVPPQVENLQNRQSNSAQPPEDVPTRSRLLMVGEVSVSHLFFPFKSATDVSGAVQIS